MCFYSDSLSISEDTLRQVWLHMSQPLPVHLRLPCLGRCVYAKATIGSVQGTCVVQRSNVQSKIFLKGYGSFVLKLQVTTRAELDIMITFLYQRAAELKSVRLWGMLEMNLALKRWQPFFAADCYRLLSTVADPGKNMKAFPHSIYKSGG